MKLTIFRNSIFQSSSSPLNENAHNVLVIDFDNTFIAVKTKYCKRPSSNPSRVMCDNFHTFPIHIVNSAPWIFPPVPPALPPAFRNPSDITSYSFSQPLNGLMSNMIPPLLFVSPKNIVIYQMILFFTWRYVRAWGSWLHQMNGRVSGMKRCTMS